MAESKHPRSKVPYNQTETYRRAHEQIDHLKEKNKELKEKQKAREAQEKKEKAEESDPERIVTAEPVPFLGLNQIKGRLSFKPLIGDPSPPSVLAIFELVEALNSYKGNITQLNNYCRVQMIKELSQKLIKFCDETEGSLSNSSSYDKGNSKHVATLMQFNKECQGVMKNNYKWLAAEPTLWNYIKNLFNSALKVIGLKPRGSFFWDTSLDSSEIIQTRNIQEGFKKVIDAGVIIEDEVDTDVDLNALKM